jgi:uncharacterized protein (TIGR00251 family)
VTAVRIELYVQPGASKTELAGMHAGLVKIRVAAPPVDNAANRALVEFLAEILSVPRRCVTVVSGNSHRRKLVEIGGVSADVVARRLNPAP